MEPPPRATLSLRLFLAAAVVAGAGATGVTALVWFSEAFRRGSSWSGLNPDGGGPGFLLLIPAAAAGMLLRAWVRPIHAEFIVALLPPLSVAALLSAGTWLVARWLLPSDFPPIQVLCTGMGIALLVAWIVTHALSALPAEPSERSAALRHRDAP